MLMLDNPCERSLPVCIVYHGHSLVIVCIQSLRLKAQASVLQISELISKIAVNGSRVHNSFSRVLILLPVFQIVYASADLAALKQPFNQSVVAVHRYALIRIVKVIIVVGIAHWKAADNKARKISAVSSPLLFRIALHQLLVDIRAHQADGLLLQVLRLALNHRPLPLNNFPGLLRSGDIPHPAEGIHVERHVVYLPLIIGYRAVGIPVKLCKLVDKVPYLPVRSMENVGAVAVYPDPFRLLAVNISSDVIPLF